MAGQLNLCAHASHAGSVALLQSTVSGMRQEGMCTLPEVDHANVCSCFSVLSPALPCVVAHLGLCSAAFSLCWHCWDNSISTVFGFCLFTYSSSCVLSPKKSKFTKARDHILSFLNVLQFQGKAIAF